MAVNTDFSLRINALESATKDLGVAKLPHDFSLVTAIASGTGATQADTVFSDTRTLTATSEALDLLGTLTSQLTGSTVSFVDVMLIAIKNNATTAGNYLLVGGGATAFSAWLGADGDIVKIPPGGLMLWYAGGVDDYKPGAGATDYLKVDSSAATISYSVLILGRSA